MLKISIPPIYTFLLIIFPLINSYDLIGVSPVLLFSVLEMILVMLWRQNRTIIRLDRRIVIYLAYMLLSATIGILHSEQNSLYTLGIKIFLYVITFFVFYVFSWQIIDFEYAIKLYVRISVILSVLVIIQFVFSLLGRGFSLVPPGLPLAGENVVSSDTIRSAQMTNNRYSTFFLEPAHQCEYILPCLAVLLFRDSYKKKGKNLLRAMLITIGLFCTTSSIGIFASIILWIYFSVVLIRRRDASWMIYLLIIVPLFLLIFSFFMRFEYIRTNIVARLAVLDIRNTTRTEGFRRIRYGWLCFGELGVMQKIFGAGYKNFGYYLAESGIGYKMMGTNDLQLISYTNGLAGMFIGLGLIGTFLNLRLFLGDCLKSKNTLVYGLLLTWGLIMATSNSFDDIVGVMPLILAMNIVFHHRKIKDRINLAV